MYISEFQEENLKDIYTLKDLRAYQEKRAELSGLNKLDPRCAMFNLVIVVGNLNKEDTEYLSLCMHQGLMQSVLMIDEDQPTDEAKAYYPMIKWSHHAKSVNDESGMAVDIAELFAKMPDSRFTMQDVIKEFPGKFSSKDLQSA